MTTEAGKRLLDEWWDNFDAKPWGSIADHVAAIEAEAVAAERARLREKVEGLPQYAFSLFDDGTDDRLTVSRAAVLAILEEE